MTLRRPNIVGSALIALLDAAATEGGVFMTTTIAGALYPTFAPLLMRDVTRKRATRVSPCNTKLPDAHVVTMTISAGLIAFIGALPRGLLAFTHPELPEDAWVGERDAMWFCATAHEDSFVTSSLAPSAVCARFPVVTPARHLRRR